MSNYEERKTFFKNFYEIKYKKQSRIGVIYLKGFKDSVWKIINLEVLL